MAWRYLKRNKTTTSPQSIFTVDTETYRTDHPTDPARRLERLRLGVARYCRLEKGQATRRYEFAFQTADQFWLWVARHVRPRDLNWIFAHGMGFDLRALLWPEMIDAKRLLLRPPLGQSQEQEQPGDKQRPPCGMLVLQDVPIIVECWLPGGAKLRLVDTRNYWPARLAALGESVELEKLPMPDPWESDDNWLAYCRRDCEILETAVLQLVRWHSELDLGVFKPTAAGLSMQSFRHRWNTPQVVLHDERDIRSLERSAYYAGQLSTFYCGRIERQDRGVRGQLFDKFTECAPRPVGPIHQLDCNSLFPSVMRGGWFPRKLLRWKFQDARNRALDVQLDAGFIARVRLRSPDEDYPYRPAATTHYCVGEFETALCGQELSRALKAGHVIDVIDWAEYELADLFTGFVDFFWQLRGMAKIAGRRLEADLCKLILNSLYGKWAQHSFEWESRPELPVVERWGHWNVIEHEDKSIRQFRAIGDMTQERLKRDEHEQAFPAISAFITAAARERMRELRTIAGYHNVYYQGVDSLYCSDLGLERLRDAGQVDSWSLGKLRHEYTGDDADFLGYNYYRVGDKRVIASIRRTALQVAADQFEQDIFERLETALARPPLGGIAVRSITRKIIPHEPLSGKTENGWIRPLDASVCMPMPIDAATCSNWLRPAVSTWLGSGAGSVLP